jgi:hypothetical protein
MRRLFVGYPLVKCGYDANRAQNDVVVGKVAKQGNVPKPGRFTPNVQLSTKT